MQPVPDDHVGLSGRTGRVRRNLLTDIWMRHGCSASKLASMFRVQHVTQDKTPSPGQQKREAKASLFHRVLNYIPGYLSIRLGSQSASAGQIVIMTIRMASHTRNGNAALATWNMVVPFGATPNMT